MPTTNKPENAGTANRSADAPATASGAPSAVAVVYATFPSPAEAERIGAELVDRRLAACVNILPGMVSLYVWDGARQRESEAAMLIKTRAELVASVVSSVRAMHPYSNPALLALPVIGGSSDFLGWIVAQTDALEGGTGAKTDAGST